MGSGADNMSEELITPTQAALLARSVDDDTDEDEAFRAMEQRAKSAQDKIADTCDQIKLMLIEKNRKYGNSALNPIRVFAKSDSLEQIRVRIDDKINRLINRQGDEDEDVVTDLIGYLILFKVAKGIS